MLNYIRETRGVKGGLYNISLEIPQSIFIKFHEEVRTDLAEDILNQYLQYRQDDARVSDVQIRQDEQTDTINIEAYLHYIGNEKTEQQYYTQNTQK